MLVQMVYVRSLWKNDHAMAYFGFPGMKVWPQSQKTSDIIEIVKNELLEVYLIIFLKLFFKNEITVTVLKRVSDCKKKYKNKQ